MLLLVNSSRDSTVYAQSSPAVSVSPRIGPLPSMGWAITQASPPPVQRWACTARCKLSRLDAYMSRHGVLMAHEPRSVWVSEVLVSV
jgi:hypothetical protein